MATINKLSLLKGVAELAVSAGVGAVVGNLVKATTPLDSGKIQKVMVSIGGWGLSGVLGDLSAKHVSSQIDNYAEKVSALFNPKADHAIEPSDKEPLADWEKELLHASDEDLQKKQDDNKPESDNQ